MSLKQLAILGGSPAFQGQLHVGRPNIGDRKLFHEYVDTIFNNRWLTNHGPMVQQFELELCDKLGVKHCIAICNATIALEIAIRALGLKGEVIVPSFTFIASAHSLQWQGITPVFCDIDLRTHNLAPLCIEKLITARTTGIMGVHLWGRPCAVDELQEICQRRSLKLLFDAAHAFGCTHQGQPVGNFGDASVFSFHATKFFNSFEGGAIATNDEDLATKVRLMRNFGFSGFDHVIQIGTNGKMSEISAAMGLVNLKSLKEFTAANFRNYQKYNLELKEIPGLSLIQYNDRENCNYQYIVIEVDQHLTGLSRDDLLKVLQAENVLARRYFWPGCHRMEPYLSNFPNASHLLPETEKVTERVLVLPNGTTVSGQDIELICTLIRIAITNAELIRTHMDH